MKNKRVLARDKMFISVMPFFTPLDENGKRLKIRMDDVKVLSGSLVPRGIGKKANIEIKGKYYKVMGIDCELEGCCCDSQIIRINK